MTQAALSEAVQWRNRLRDFHDDYTACLDDLRLESWPDFFTDDARYQVIAAENFDAGLVHATIFCNGIAMIRDRALAVSKTMVFQPRQQRRFVSGVRISRIDGGGVHAQANFMIVETRMDDEPRVVMAGRYVDIVTEARDGRLRFRERSCVYDNFRVSQSIVIPV